MSQRKAYPLRDKVVAEHLKPAKSQQNLNVNAMATKEKRELAA